MKKHIKLVAATIISAAFLFSSCTKSDSGSSNTLSATVGTKAYSFNNCYAVSAGTSLTISGSSGTVASPTYPYFTIIIPSWTGSAGTFNFDSTLTTNYAEFIRSSTIGDFELSKSGSIVITSVSSTTVSGTFSFNATDGTSISGGKFTAKRM